MDKLTKDLRLLIRNLRMLLRLSCRRRRITNKLSRNLNLRMHRMTAKKWLNWRLNSHKQTAWSSRCKVRLSRLWSGCKKRNCKERKSSRTKSMSSLKEMKNYWLRLNSSKWNPTKMKASNFSTCRFSMRIVRRLSLNWRLKLRLSKKLINRFERKTRLNAKNWKKQVIYLARKMSLLNSSWTWQTKTWNKLKVRWRRWKNKVKIHKMKTISCKTSGCNLSRRSVA